MNLMIPEITYHDLSRGPVVLTAAGRQIGVFRVGDEVFAVDNLCPHAHQPLHTGYVEGEVVECPFHNARFHLRTGRCLRGPGTDIQSYPVRHLGDRVRIDCRPLRAGCQPTNERENTA